jgi:hypothetical protein
MKVDMAFSGSVACIEALVKFLRCVEQSDPQPIEEPHVVMGDDGVIYVKAGFATEEEAWQAGEKMAEVSAGIVEDTDVLVVLAPFVASGKSLQPCIQPYPPAGYQA